MSRNPRLYLEDMHQAGKRILQFIEGLSLSEFQMDQRTTMP
jgi:uncharacterized protein with HEPN domain